MPRSRTIPSHSPAAQAELAERRRQARGLLLLALLVMLLSALRAGARHLFPHGWWRL